VTGASTRRLLLSCFVLAGSIAVSGAAEKASWLWTTAYRVPPDTTNQESGYFSIIEGADRRLYIGTAKYGQNAYLVAFDPRDNRMRVVVDAHAAIGTDAEGFAAQAKIHTRNNVGASGRIYFGTKQGYPEKGEHRDNYAGGYPMVYDPATDKTRVYDIPVSHHGIISITPDESRGVAYISTSSDARPVDGAHFLQLNLETGAYRDFGDLQHMYAFIVVDSRGRAYHPELGGAVVRYDPVTDRLERLQQLIDGQPPSATSRLAAEKTHPINWDISPDRKTLYAVAMSTNALYAYDLTAPGPTLPGRFLGKLLRGRDKTDCRALCVGPDGTVWAGVAAGDLHVVSYRPGIDESPRDHGPLAVRNPDFAVFVDAAGKAKQWHHGYARKGAERTVLVPRYHIMGICAASDGTVYVTTLYPFTLHAISSAALAGTTSQPRPE
jgi:sugar lactone lactonase YvrE